ncbi:MAG: N-6 DNA methylase, partial [bacterium]
MMARAKHVAKDSEVHAYAFIKDKLRGVGWDIRNPERVSSGQVWTQNECLSNPEIKRFLGLQKPENIVKVSETMLWVFESKRSHVELAKALSEAEGYARTLNKSKRLKAQFITGVAGNDIDSFLTRTCFLTGDTYVPVTINGVDVTGFLSPMECQTLLERGSPNLDNIAIDENLFRSRATRINEILHLGAVNPHQRANVMAALLLSMIGGTEPNVNERDPSVLIQDINTRAESVLRQQKKPEFAEQIRISPPAAKDNHIKFRQALVDTLQELRDLNIRSAMNSGSDVLGTFYEVFIKYANWAQDLGIVLTPRHITRWVAGVMDIQVTDIVYDPTCGTGGFLVAAFDYVKQHASESQIDRFKQNGLFGIEQDSGIAALAIVNMIFRGDGKNNIIEANCLAKHLSPHVNRGVPSAKWSALPSNEPPVTKVMMNPPFALRSGEDKEYKFVDQALRQMQHGTTLFSVLPYPAMVKSGVYKNWRKEMLSHNTLLAVVTFPGDIFYPVGMPAVGVFIKKGVSHSSEQHVLWIRAVRDGFVKSKKKRLRNPKEPDDLSTVSSELRAFITNPSRRIADTIQVMKSAPIDLEDEEVELVPEVYLEEQPPLV